MFTNSDYSPVVDSQKNSTLYAIGVFDVCGYSSQGCDVKIKGCSYNLSNVNFLLKNKIREGLNAGLKLIATRGNDNFSYYEYDCYGAYLFIDKENEKRFVVISDKNYPKCTTMKLGKELLKNKLSNNTELINKNLDVYLTKYRNPDDVNKILKINNELDDIKGLMIKNVETLINRGEKLDSLIDKTNELSYTSKVFFKNTRKLNRCSNCIIL